ncbi:bifunctional riboflavin kinase/FAD synthetase [bacterium]|nr:bifunctional riboflavin kinase/FAD synthetase [bacterium]
MQIYEQLTYINKTSLALGFFDGIHQGHKVVLKNAINIAKENNTSSTIITFKNHPLNVLTNQKVEQILTLDEKIAKFQALGVDNVVILDFKAISNIKAQDYLENILIKYYSPIAITTGYNHSFGFNKEGNSEFLKSNQNRLGYKYFEIPPCVIDGDVVSCSVIRNKLQLGNFIEANKLLGYNFFVTGKVIHGDKIASKLGFPSANIQYPKEKISIPTGVYYVQVDVNGKIYNGILNHGYFDAENRQKLKTETHIIDFNQDIYGEKITIQFISKIRNQMKFENSEKLKAQIYRDIAFANIYQHFLFGNIKLNMNKYDIL